MVYELLKTSRFKAGVKLARKRGLDMTLVDTGTHSDIFKK